jgi:hypothetical protein
MILSGTDRLMPEPKLASGVGESCCTVTDCGAFINECENVDNNRRKKIYPKKGYRINFMIGNNILNGILPLTRLKELSNWHSRCRARGSLNFVFPFFPWDYSHYRRYSTPSWY